MSVLIANSATAMAIAAHAALNDQQRLDHMQHHITANLSPARRNDSQNANLGFNLARDLEYTFGQVTEERYAPHNAFRLFRVNSEIPAGAKYATIRRKYQQGTAQVFGGGEVEANVKVTQDEETFHVRHYVTGFEYDLFEAQSSQYAGTGHTASHMRAAREVLMEFANWKIWLGDPQNKIYGVANYPWLQKAVSALTYDSTSAPDQIIKDLNKWAKASYLRTKTVYKPNRVAVSPWIREYLMETPRSTTTDTTIGEFWCNTNSRGIKSIDEAWELDELAPEGYGAMLFWNDSAMGLENMMVNPFSIIPLQLTGFAYKQYGYMSHAGIKMVEVAGNVLVFVPKGDNQ